MDNPLVEKMHKARRQRQLFLAVNLLWISSVVVYACHDLAHHFLGS